MQIKKLLIFLYVASPLFAFSQLERSIWYIGANVGLDFKTEPTSVFAGGPSEGAQGIALDTTGKLLFYTDGQYLLNRFDNEMPSWRLRNGSSEPYYLKGGGDIEQNVIVLPYPGWEGRYLIIHTDVHKYEGTGSAYYSIVNMKADNGNGDINPDDKNIMLATDVGASVVAIRHANMKDYWLIIRNLEEDVFYTYLVDSSGISEYRINSPILGGASNSKIGVSQDGRWLANIALGNSIEIYVFDNSTGTLSFSRNFDGEKQEGMGVYSNLEFSPNGMFLYTTLVNNEGIFLYQLDISKDPMDGHFLSFRKSRFDEDNVDDSLWDNMVLGIDGRIYLGVRGDLVDWYRGRSLALDVILYPDKKGSNCEYRKEYVDIKSKHSRIVSLPNFPVNPPKMAPIITTSEMHCVDAEIIFSVSNPEDMKSVLWEFDDGQNSAVLNPQYSYSKLGKHRVTLTFTDKDNKQGALTKEIIIYPTPKKPIIIQE